MGSDAALLYSSAYILEQSEPLFIGFGKEHKKCAHSSSPHNSPNKQSHTQYQSRRLLHRSVTQTEHCVLLKCFIFYFTKDRISH